MADLVSLPLALPDQSFAARQAIDEAAARAGLELDPVFVTGSLEMLKELVQGSAAITLLPKLAVLRDIEQGEMHAVPFVSAQQVKTEIDLCVAPDRPLSIAAETFARFIEMFMSREG